MFGITEYIAVGGIAAAVAWGGYQTIVASNAETSLQEARAETAKARGALQTCANRITNIQEAAESNASIPDNLVDFDVPSSWMLGGDRDDAATD